MPNKSAITEVESEFRELFVQLSTIQDIIRQRLTKFSDGKTLKGHELVGWLGEIYGKILLGGRLVDDSEEHDIETTDKLRISVKARKGWSSGWKRSSAIPKVEGFDCPTHLLFVHLNDDYSIDRIWKYEWSYLNHHNRFKKHVVRGSHRSYIFTLDERNDSQFVIFSGTDTQEQC